MESRKPNHFFSLIVPIYRQEKTIVKNIFRVKSALDKIRYDYEIIAVVDGIIDSSLKKIKNARIDKVKTIAYVKNQGKAHAIRLGMKKAKGDYVMFIDSGMEIDPNGISMLLEHMEWYNADIIVGSKRHLASQVNYTVTRKVLSQGYYYFVKFLFGIKIKDTQAGIKIFRKKVLEKILPKLVEKKFAGDLEMLVAANSSGFTRIYEAPIRLDYKLGKLTGAATMKSIVGIFLDTMALFYRANIGRYYIEKKKLKNGKAKV